jgi:peptidoglycan-N-acetylglucosamine deacetylase
MDKNKRFTKYISLVVYGTILTIIGIVCLPSTLLSYKIAKTTPTYLPPINTQSSIIFPTLESATSTPFQPESPTLMFTPLPSIWYQLPAIPYDDRGLITNGDRSELKVALTFDLCQSEGDLAGYDTEIIRVLNQLQAPATFFAGGQWMRDHQTETLDLAHNPLFAIGNHSWSHLDFNAITVDEMKAEITLTQQFMYDLLGYQTNLFRLPYGTYNDDALKIIGENGLYTIQWDVVSGDPDPNIDAESMTSWVLQQVQPGSIIIMHANGRGWHTAEALPAIIQSIRQQGYALVTVPDLLGIQSQK